MLRWLYLFFFTSLVLTTSAQSLLLSNDNGPLPNNSTLILYGGDEYIESKAYITNNTGTDLSIMLRATDLVLVYGTYNYFCWGQCYPDTNASEVPVLIPAGTTDSLNFACHYICQGNNGTTIVRYTFFDINNPTDSVCFKISYNANTAAGLSANDHDTSISGPYPNPANGFFTIDYHPGNETDPLYCTINNLQGEIVHQVRLDSPDGHQKIEIKSLMPGMYFCTVRHGNTNVLSRKLIVE